MHDDRYKHMQLEAAIIRVLKHRDKNKQKR